jgi:hypothetical protein
MSFTISVVVVVTPCSELVSDCTVFKARLRTLSISWALAAGVKPIKANEIKQDRMRCLCGECVMARTSYQIVTMGEGSPMVGPRLRVIR